VTEAGISVPGVWLACFLVGLGGALGSICRYLMAVCLPKIFNLSLPGTLVANVVGCTIAGFILGWAARGPSPTNPWLLSHSGRLLLLTGFCGGLTTFSTFAAETDSLIRAPKTDLAMIYLILTLTASALALRVGTAAAILLPGRT
jgi:CrcB protein